MKLKVFIRNHPETFLTRSRPVREGTLPAQPGCPGFKKADRLISMVREGPSCDLKSFTDTGQSYFSFILIIDTIQMK